MPKEKNNTGLIIFLCIIILILGIVTYLSLTGTLTLSTNNSNNEAQGINEIEENTTKYTYNNIYGIYSYTSDTMKDENGNEFQAYYNLYLYEDGTFSYRMGHIAPFGYSGNYTIEDNKIILNYFFKTGSGTGLEITNGTKTIIINSDNTLTDENQSNEFVNLTSITLTKNSGNEDTKANYEYYRINNLINKYLEDSNY